jgi:hypothetical protein
MSVRKLIFFTAAVAMVCGLAGSAMAESVLTMQSQSNGIETLDNAGGSYPVVTAVLSMPGTYNGKSYTSYSFLVDDGTGGEDIYGSLNGLGYTPKLGDALTITGSVSPYHQIPELENITAISTQASGGATVTSPVPSTITTLSGGGSGMAGYTIPNSVAGRLISLTGVTISGVSGSFGIANLSGTITDGSGNSMGFYYWPTSYSAANVNLYGNTVPTGLVNMTGFVSEYPGDVPEFSPITITPDVVPEPMTIIPACAGLVLAIGACVRRKFS